MKFERLPSWCVFLVAAVISVLVHPIIWQRAHQGYSGDSLFTLSMPAMLGLFLLSGLLALTLLCLNLWKTRALKRVVTRLHSTHPHPGNLLINSPGYCIGGLVVDAAIITGLYWVLLSAVPQLYYVYYRIVFDGLPAQWVIKLLPAVDYWQIISLSGQANSSVHFSGWLFSCLLVSAGLIWVFEARR